MRTEPAPVHPVEGLRRTYGKGAASAIGTGRKRRHALDHGPVAIDGNALDLRAGAALVIAGLAADGITTVDDIKYIQRGYEKFDEKLRSLGGEIEQISSQREAQRFRLRVV